jgi:hypothetical protein
MLRMIVEVSPGEWRCYEGIYVGPARSDWAGARADEIHADAANAGRPMTWEDAYAAAKAEEKS